MAEDIEPVAAAMQDISLSGSNAAVSKPAIPNFPIPRELRDKIYSYLLHYEYVEDEPYHTRPKEERSEVSPVTRPHCTHQEK